jgi:hypothetical protein
MIGVKSSPAYWGWVNNLDAFALITNRFIPEKIAFYSIFVNVEL